MSLLVPRRARVEKDIVTHVKRTVPGTSKILVAPGQEVSPEHLVGQAELSSGFRKLNLAEGLQVSPLEAKKYLQRKIGQSIYMGELLAYKPIGFFGGKKFVVAPTDGVIDFYDDTTGELRLSFLPKKLNIPAAVYGVVEYVDRFKGEVTIRTQVTRIHGVVGSGKIRDGILHVVSRFDIVSSERVNQSFAERIVVGGGLIYKEAIAKGIKYGVNGIITGGINAKDFLGMSSWRLVTAKPTPSDIGITLMATEGFGSIGMGSDQFDILVKYQDKFVILDGVNARLDLPTFDSSCMIKIRKTRLPSLVTEQVFAQDNIELKLGIVVRVIGTHFLGEQGKVVAIDRAETLLPSGLKSQLVTLETKSRKIKIPYSNLEVIS